jgi:hypothetical protein
MNIERMNGIMDMIRHEPLNIRQIATYTTIPAPVVEECISILVKKEMAKVAHVRKLKMSKVPYYQLTNKSLKYESI